MEETPRLLSGSTYTLTYTYTEHPIMPYVGQLGSYIPVRSSAVSDLRLIVRDVLVVAQGRIPF